jgi:Gas vesicle protein
MSTHGQAAQQQEVALVDLVDRLLAGGVVLGGDITLSIADVDLIYLRLRVLLGSASSLDELGLALPRAEDEPPA